MKKILLSFALFCSASYANVVTIKDVDIIFDSKDDVAQISVRAMGKSIKIKTKDDFTIASIEQKFNINEKIIVLISQSTGGNGCPAQYFFLTVDGSTVSRSPDFGTCSDLVKTSQNDQKITATMPSMATGKIQTYTFEAGVLKENGRVLK